jgi:SPP1 family predicted phage head-tail adaptor
MIGKLRDRINLINYSTTPNGSGGTDATERTDITLWAKVTPLSGSRGVDGGQITLNQAYEIHIRYEDYPPLNKKIRVQFENRILVIHAYQIVQERKKYFKIIAMEDAGRDEIIYDEQFQPITDELGNYITIE